MTSKPQKLASIVLTMLLSVGSICTGDEKFPEWSKVEGVVDRHFARMPDYQDGDLITRSQVGPIFERTRLLGWNVDDRAAIIRDVLSDGDFLVSQLNSAKGKTFMRKLAREPLAFDRLDLASRLPGGKLMVRDFLRFGNSERSFSPQGSQTLARMARLAPDQKRDSETPTRADFSKPTGKIYTVAALKKRLRASYDAEVRKRSEVSKP